MKEPAHSKEKKKKRTLGTFKGKIRIIDPDWWKPMTDAEVDDFIFGYKSDPLADLTKLPRKTTKMKYGRK
jgi:hypothetical protein